MVIAFFKGFLLTVAILFVVRAMGLYMISEEFFDSYWLDLTEFFSWGFYPSAFLGVTFMMDYRRKQKTKSVS